jgi:hypothetical protein
MTVAQCIAAAEAASAEPQTFSHWLTEHRDILGRDLSSQDGFVHNLTTDTASGFTNRRDWQAKAMGGGLPPVASMTGTLTGSSGTTATNSGASFPTSGQALAGCIVVVGPNASGTGAISWGIIQSNSGTVLTVDQWYSGGTWAIGTTPNATGLYTVLPGQAPAMWIAVTGNATAPTSADTTLNTEATTNGFGRQLAVYAHTAAATTYTLQTTFTATGSLTIQVECESGSAVANKGVMPFESAVPSPPVMISGDTCQITSTITIN